MQTNSDVALGRRAFLFAGAVIAPMAKAVEPGKPSKTSLSTAAGRAIASRDPNPETRCPDSMAVRLIRREDLDSLTGSSIPALYDLPWDEVLRRESTAGRYPYLNMTLRTMHIDAKIRAAVAEGLAELVILGFYKANTALYRSWGEPQTFGIPGYDSRRFVEHHGLRLRSDYTFGELCLLYTPRLDPASMDYRRLYYRIAHAVIA